jgi:hypothetical protein
MKSKKAAIVLAVIVVAAAGALVYRANFEYVTYVQDPANTCIWKNGKVAGTTEVGYEANFTPPQKRILKINENNFIAQVSKAGQCWYKNNESRPH